MPAQRWEIHKMSLNHSAVPESKDVEICPMTQEPPGRAPNGQSWKNSSNKLNEVVLDYHPKYTTDIHESLQLRINERMNKWERMGNLFKQNNSR